MQTRDGPDGTTLDLRVSALAFKAIGAIKAQTSPEGPRDGRSGQSAPGPVRPDILRQLYDAAVSPDNAAMDRMLELLRSTGLSDDRIVGTYVPAVARRLGECWLADTASFSLVTYGCARLQGMLRRMEDRAAPLSDECFGVAPASLLIVVPEGTQHSLGAIVLAAQLRRAGASVRTKTDVNSGTLARLVTEQHPDGVLISAAAGDSLEVLSGLVKSVRKASARSKILIGGSVLDCKSDVRTQTGTDLITSNWQEALRFCRPVQTPVYGTVETTGLQCSLQRRVASGRSS